MGKLDYIIIGSGMAGTHTAYRLQQKGRKVLLLEKESYPGGRMSTHEIDGRFIDFGAKFIASLYRNMLPLAKELGVGIEPINLTKAAIRKEGEFYFFDGAKRISQALKYKGIPLRAKLQLAFATAWTLARYRHLDLYNLEDALYLDDKSTYDDFRPVAGPEAFDHLIEPFNQNVLFYPTKDFSRAAFYSVLLKLATMKTYNFPRGIGQLNQIMAASLPVEFNVQVKSVRRTENGVVVAAIKEGKEVAYEADKVVLAIPGNRVLDILENPLPEEKEFFLGVRYASTVQIFCEARTDLFDKANVVWTLPKEESNFTALGKGGAKKTGDGRYRFIAALRSNTYKRLRDADDLTPERFKQLIQDEFPNISELRVIRVQIWESATPIVYPGYLKTVFKFLKNPGSDSRVYFCGDYFENPSTEGALTSSIKLLRNLNV